MSANAKPGSTTYSGNVSTNINHSNSSNTCLGGPSSPSTSCQSLNYDRRVSHMNMNFSNGNSLSFVSHLPLNIKLFVLINMISLLHHAQLLSSRFLTALFLSIIYFIGTGWTGYLHLRNLYLSCFRKFSLSHFQDDRSYVIIGGDSVGNMTVFSYAYVIAWFSGIYLILAG